MARRFFRAILRLALRIFFRRIEVVGLNKIQSLGPVIFAVNHPNGLIDPLFLLCLAPRCVSFLAKAPLFQQPLVGFFVRTFDSIPVYRQQDPGADISRNQETFERARAVLARGGAIALFPEGTSHSGPKMRRAKTGAARIALGAAASERPPEIALRIVPAGLYYSAKGKFRSSALLSFGDPLPVPALALEEDGEPPARAVRELTRRMEAALAELTLQADSHESLDLIARAERIFSREEEGSEQPLTTQLDLRRRFVEGATRLRERDPVRFDALEREIARFESQRREAGLTLEHLTPQGLTIGGLLRLLGKNLAALFILPFAAVGAMIHYPAYRLAGFIATNLARQEEDVLSTIKVIASLLLFPGTWLLAAGIAAWLLGRPGGLAAALLVPLSSYAALRTREALDSVIGRARALAHLALRGYATRRLLAQRLAIREEILRLAREMDLVADL